VKLLTKLREIADADLDGLNLTDFGTRRRHSFLWQRYCVEAAQEIVGSGFTGTSNVLLAKELGLEARGTNAHELPMTLAALTQAMGGNEQALRESQYQVCREWGDFYPPALRVMLPDTLGTTQFLEHAPEALAHWTGIRPDSKEPNDAAQEAIDFWLSRGQDPKTKLVLFSDGLNHTDIIDLHRAWSGKVRVGFGWGTNLTNDFKGCCPGMPTAFNPISLVAKVSMAALDGRSATAVKLSDNYNKATGTDGMIEIYRKAFGHAGMEGAPVLV
jgi:nicotinate phosphoribosyltransferase